VCFNLWKLKLCHTYNITYFGNGYYLCFLSKEKCDSLLLGLITWSHEFMLQVIREVIVVRDPCFCVIVKPKTKKLKDS
jgi:hypothetical protein